MTRLTCVCVLAVLPIAAGFPAFADPLAETVTVTASRTSIALDDIGSSVTIIDRDEIEARQSLFVTDLLRGVPGVAVSRSGGPGSVTQARMRGAEANHVLVLIDGVAVNDAFAGDEIPLELLTSFDIERIEIVRGPQSGLWGADALAGVINIITRSTDDGAEAAVEAGSFDTRHGAGRLSLGRGDLRVAFSGSYLDTDGTDVSRAGNEDDGASNATTGLHMTWMPAESPLELDISARHTDATAEFDGVDFVTTGLPTDADNETETALSLLQATGRWDAPTSAWTHDLHASFATTNTDTFAAGAPAGSTAIDKASVSWQSSVDLAPRAARVERRLTAALDHEERRFEQRGEASPFGDPNQDRRLDATGGVVEFRIGEPGSWSVSTSLRHDDHSDFGDETTYRATASYVVVPGTRVRASVGTGQKPPTFIERFGFFADTFVGNPDLRPETSTGYELGVDRAFGARLRGGLTYFRSRLEDEINGFAFDSDQGVFTARNEPFESDRQGVEVQVEADLGRTRVYGTYTYTDARQPDGASGDDEELRRPRHLANLRVRHTFERVPLDLQLNVAHTGSRTDLFFPPFPEPSATVRLASYVLADVTARYALGAHLDVYARVENAFDEDYEDILGFATPGIGASIGLRYRARP